MNIYYRKGKREMGVMEKKITKSYEAFALEWDTQYFKVSSAKTILKNFIPKNERMKLINDLKKFEFHTIVNCGNNPQNNDWIGRETDAFLTDLNIQFKKQLQSMPIGSDGLAEVFECFPYNPQVLEITRKSFIYSRFFNDPYLQKDLAQGIYMHWIECAFSKENKFFSIAKIEGKIAGFLLFSQDKQNACAVIELIAVDETYRGLNIGKRLLDEVESFVYPKEIKWIKVGTQINNASAVQFYLKCGFKYSNCNAIYHLWPRKLSNIG